MTLAVDHLTVLRGGSEVVRDVGASLEPGTITAIVGPNGAGKSSLLMALAGLLEPVTGEVMLDRRKLSVMPSRERARSIGYLPQDGDIAWDVSVEALVALGRMPHGDSRREPVHAAIDALALDPFRNRPVSRLSGGEKARVLLARVLAGEPRWILADEPLAALDLAHQLSLIDHFRHTARAGTGIVLVLHDLALAMNHADRVLVLDNGVCVADGPPQEALSPDLIARVWRTRVEWLGKAGRYAMTVQSRP